MSHDLNGQLSIFDMAQSAPDYHGAMDEITRYSIELDFEQKIILQKHCSKSPEEYFRSCHEYFVKCPVCGKRTKYHRKAYQAKQAWNRGEIE